MQNGVHENAHVLHDKRPPDLGLLLPLGLGEQRIDIAVGRGDVKIVVYYVPQCHTLRVFVGKAQQSPAVALGQGIVAQRREHVLRQLEQPQLIGNGGLRLAYPSRRLLLAHAEKPYELAQPVCFLDEIQVAPLKIFDKGNEARVLKPHVQQDARHLIKTGKARGAEPSFARDKLVSALAQTHRKRV